MANDYGEFFDENTQVVPYGDYNIKVYPYSHLVIGVFFGIAIFMAALAWNFAIRSTITYLFETNQVSRDAVNARTLLVGWIYTIILTAVILSVLFLFRRRIPPEVLKY